MRRQASAIAAVIVVLGLSAWMLIAPGALVRYPDDLDQTLTYRGQIAVADPTGQTGASVAPLTITRHIWVASATFGTARIRERVTTRFGTEVHEQTNGYVIDRRTMKTRTTSGNFAFTTDNPVDRENSYGPNLPMNVSADGKYQLWSDDTATAYNVVGDGTSIEIGGVTITMLKANVSDRPVTEAYARFLDLPRTATLTTLAKFADVNLDRVLAALANVVSPLVMAELSDPITAPIPLRYSIRSTGEVGVEPRTGAIVDIENVANQLSVSPDLSSLRLDTILGAYAQDPVVRTVLAEFDELANRPPRPAMTIQYSQTSESVRAAVAVAKGLRDDARRVTLHIPLGLAALALLLVVGAIFPPRRQAATLHLFHRHDHATPTAA